MGVKIANNAYGYLAVSIDNLATIITLNAGQGTRFPTVAITDSPPTWFWGTLVDSSNNIEVFKCTVHTVGSDAFGTIIRGQDGTTARAFAAGSLVELRPTAAAMNDKLDADQKEASGGVPGLTGYALNVWNAGKTFMANIVSVGTANWTHTLPNRSGTLADNTDIAAERTAASVSPIFVGSVDAAKRISMSPDTACATGTTNKVDAFASGTRMLFIQSAAPLGWTVDATMNDRVIRVNSAAGNSVGGSWAISGLTTGDLNHNHYMDHTHGAGSYYVVDPDNYGGVQGGTGNDAPGVRAVQGNSAGASIPYTSASGSLVAGVNSNSGWRPSYVDSLICTKN